MVLRDEIPIIPPSCQRKRTYMYVDGSWLAPRALPFQDVAKIINRNTIKPTSRCFLPCNRLLFRQKRMNGAYEDWGSLHRKQAPVKEGRDRLVPGNHNTVQRNKIASSFLFCFI